MFTLALLATFVSANVDDTLADGLAADGVQAIALVFRGVGDAPEAYDRETMIALRDRHAKNGLHIWVVTGNDPREPCKPAGLRRVKTLCRDEEWRARFGHTKNDTGAYLWTWRGRRWTTDAPIASLGATFERALAAESRVAVTGEASATAELRRAMTRVDKLRLFDPRTESAWLARVDLPRAPPPCPTLAHSDTILRATRAGGAFRAILIDAERGCVVASAAGDAARIARTVARAFSKPPDLPASAVPATIDVATAPDVEAIFDDDAGVRLRAEAKRWVGVPFKRWGKRRTGVDDAQLVRVVFRRALGVDVGLDRRAMAGRGEPITVDPNDPGRLLSPGDLVFVMGQPGRAQHVGLYLGSGEWIHAVEGRGVVLETLFFRSTEAQWLSARRPERYDPRNR